MQQETREVVFELRKPAYQGGEVIKEIPFTAYRSKWGWHPISYEDFQILRELRKRFWQTLRMAYAWQRWARKAPQNRVVYTKLYAESGPHAGAVNGRAVVCALPEPQVDPLFIDTSKVSEFGAPNSRGNWGFGCRTHHCLFTPRLGAQIVNPNRKAWSLAQRKKKPCIVEDFNLARMPQEDPEKLAPLDMAFYREVWAELTAGVV
jgi:hypothetical protein